MLEDEIDRVLNEKYSTVESKQSGVDNKLFVKKISEPHSVSYSSKASKNGKPVQVNSFSRGGTSGFSKQTKQSFTKLTAVGVVLLLVSVASAGVMVGFWMQNTSNPEPQLPDKGDGRFIGDDPGYGEKGPTPGTIPGSFTVDNFGQASYSMPIEVPPGTAGMQPSLSVNYNSMAGNGPIGVGFYLGGLSVITRDACDIVRDGYKATLFSDDARLALDGMRLVRVDGLPYTFLEVNEFLKTQTTQTSIEFRKKIDDNTRIKVFGDYISNGIRHFTVEHTNGIIMYYGHVDDIDGRIKASEPNNEVAYLFALVKVKDQYGNYMHYQYSKDQSNSAYRITSIKYTGNNQVTPQLVPYNEILFYYESREDTIPLYDGGSRFVQTVRLNQIRTKSHGDVVFNYHLEYSIGESSGNSRLQKIALGGIDYDLWYPDTTFEWSADPSVNKMFETGQTNSYDWGSLHLLMDVNGDGRQDIVQLYNDTSSGSNMTGVKIFLSDGERLELTHTQSMGPWANEFFPDGAFKGNDQKKSNQNYQGRRTSSVSYIWGDNWGGNSQSQMPHGEKGDDPTWVHIDKFISGDFNGDGRDDIVKISKDGAAARLQLWESAGSSFWFIEYVSSSQLIGQWTSDYETGVLDRYIAADVNGDGLDDIIKIYKSGDDMVLRTYISQGDDSSSEFFVESSNIVTLGPVDDDLGRFEQYIVMDINGDGFDDIVRVYYENLSYNINAFADIFMATVNGNTITYNKEQTIELGSWGYKDTNTQKIKQYNHILAADINGDGRGDLVKIGTDSYSSTTALTMKTWQSDGIQLQFPDSCTVNPNIGKDFDEWWTYFPADFNGDGKTDIGLLNFQPAETNFFQSIYYIEGNGLGTFTELIELFSDNAAHQQKYDVLFLPIDVNGDGITDIVRLKEFEDYYGDIRSEYTVFMKKYASEVQIQIEPNAPELKVQIDSYIFNYPGARTFVNGRYYLKASTTTSNFQFSHWESTCGTVLNEYDEITFVDVKQSGTLKAVFNDVTTHTIQFRTQILGGGNGGGTITFNGETYNHNSHTHVPSGTYTIKANANDGYEFHSWLTYSGGIIIPNTNQNQQSVQVSGSDTLLARFNMPGDKSSEPIFFDDPIDFGKGEKSYSDVSVIIPDRLIEINDGLGAVREITYQPLPIIYGGHKGENPLYTRDLAIPFWVVSEYQLVGLGQTKQYSYYGAKLHQHDFGFLGFNEIEIKEQYGFNPPTYRLNKRSYYQQFPYIGVLKSESSGTIENDEEYIISKTTHSYNSVEINSKSGYNNRYQVRWHSSTDMLYNYPDTDELLSETYSRAWAHDDFGNVLEWTSDVRVPKADGTLQYVHLDRKYSLYENRVGSNQWIIGLPEQIISQQAYDFDHGFRTTTTNYAYNNKGRLWRIENEPYTPDDEQFHLITSYNYDGFGNQISKDTFHKENGVNKQITHFTKQYDSNGQFILWGRNAHYQFTYYNDYNVFGKPTQITDINELTTQYFYDPLGRLYATIYPDGTIQNMIYSFDTNDIEQATFSIKQQKTGQPTTWKYFDQLSRIVHEKNQGYANLLVNTKTIYDLFGREILSSMPYFTNEPVFYTQYDYDILGRVNKITQPFTESGETAESFFSYDGFVTTMTDPLGHQTITTNNALGQTIRVENPLGAVISFFYDSSGNLITKSDNVHQVVSSWDYDIYNRLKTHTDPNSGTQTFIYNALNQQISKTDAKGNLFEMKYDNLGRMTRMDYPDGYTTWEYDDIYFGLGLLSKSSSYLSNNFFKSSTQYTYDSFSRIQTQTKTHYGETYNFSYVYDQYSRLQKKIYPTDVTLLYDYDVNGYLSKISRQRQQEIIEPIEPPITSPTDPKPPVSEKNIMIPVPTQPIILSELSVQVGNPLVVEVGGSDYDDIWPLSYTIDWGDGTVDSFTLLPAEYTELFYNWDEAGLYTVTVNVYDPTLQRYRSSSVEIEVSDSESSKAPGQPSTPSIYGPTISQNNVEVSFCVGGSTFDGNLLNYTLYWGDGTVHKFDLAPTEMTTRTHTYSDVYFEKEEYDIYLLVSDAGNPNIFNSASHTITVYPEGLGCLYRIELFSEDTEGGWNGDYLNVSVNSGLSLSKITLQEGETSATYDLFVLTDGVVDFVYVADPYNSISNENWYEVYNPYNILMFIDGKYNNDAVIQGAYTIPEGYSNIIVDCEYVHAPTQPIIQGPNSAYANTELSFTMGGSNYAIISQELTYRVIWGDGSPYEEFSLTSGQTTQRTHTYSEPGSYQIYLYVFCPLTNEIVDSTSHLVVITKKAESGAITPSALVWQLAETSPFGTPTKEIFGNGIITTTSVNKASGRIETIESFHRSNPTFFIQNNNYIYDRNGNILERDITYWQDGVQHGLYETFSYDALNRLIETADTPTDSTLTYSDSTEGNILSKSDVNPNGANFYQYQLQGHPQAVSAITFPQGQVNIDYSYDVSGNLISKISQSNAEELIAEYNSMNMPNSITKTINNQIAHFVLYNYDESLQKMSKLEYGEGFTYPSVTRYINNLYEEYEPEWVFSESRQKRHYIYAAGRPVAIYTLDEDMSIYQGDTWFLHADILGSIECITNRNGNVVQRFGYDAWGRRRNPSDGSVLLDPVSIDITDRGFTGHRHVDGLGLIDMKARMYDPQTALFLSVDPLGGAYTYANNNPLKFIDPTGLAPTGAGFGPDRSQDNQMNKDMPPGNNPALRVAFAVDKYSQVSHIDEGGAGGGTTSSDAGGPEESGGSDEGSRGGERLLSEVYPDAYVESDKYGNRWITIDGFKMLDMSDTEIHSPIDDPRGYKNLEHIKYNDERYVLYHNRWLRVDYEGAAKHINYNYYCVYTYPYTQKAIQHTIIQYELKLLYTSMALGAIGFGSGLGFLSKGLQSALDLSWQPFRISWGGAITGAIFGGVGIGLKIRSDMQKHDSMVDYYRQNQ